MEKNELNAKKVYVAPKMDVVEYDCQASLLLECSQPGDCPVDIEEP